MDGSSTAAAQNTGDGGAQSPSACTPVAMVAAVPAATELPHQPASSSAAAPQREAACSPSPALDTSAATAAAAAAELAGELVSSSASAALQYLRHHCELAVMTLGEHGCLVASQTEPALIWQPAKKGIQVQRLLRIASMYLRLPCIVPGCCMKSLGQGHAACHQEGRGGARAWRGQHEPCAALSNLMRLVLFPHILAHTRCWTPQAVATSLQRAFCTACCAGCRRSAAPHTHAWRARRRRRCMVHSWGRRPGLG